jgi:hypothetical protein
MVKDAAEFGRQALVAFESLVVHADGEREHSIHDNILHLGPSTKARDAI